MKDTAETGAIPDTFDVIGEFTINTVMSYLSGSKGDKISVKNQDLSNYKFKLIMVVDDGNIHRVKVK